MATRKPAKKPAPAPKKTPKPAAAPKKVAAAPARKKAPQVKAKPKKPARQARPTPAAPVEPAQLGLTDLQQRFVDEYLVDLNGTQAAIRAGYSADTARQMASENLSKPYIQIAIVDARKRQQARTHIEADRVVLEAWNIVFADPRELVQVKVGCCRHCWGEGFKFQRTVGEFNHDREHFALKGGNMAEFDEKGGIGFDPLKPPHAECPDCGGDGNLIGASLEGIRGYEEANRTDWRVTSNGQPGGQDVADAISFKLNEAERKSKADDACSGAFYPQIAVGIGWAEVCRNSDPFDYPYQCNVIHRNEIHWDWASTKLDLSDARWLRRQRWMHPSRLARVFPDQKELIRRYGRAGINWWAEFDETQHGGGSTGLNRAWDVAREWTRLEDRWFNPMNKEVCASELWYRRWSDVIVLKSPDGRVVEYDENNPAHVFALAKGRVQFMRATVAKVRRSYWLGPHVLFDGPSPYAHRYFPYVPFWGFREDGTGVPFGYVRNLMDQQDTLNNGNARLRWGMSSYRTERTKGAVDMPDDVFRRTINRPDADIVLNAAHMAQQGARFEVKRDFQANAQQLEQLQNARNAIERINPAAAGAFSGRRGTANSGIQEQTQVEQANQSLAHMMGNQKRARTLVGEMLVAMIVQDIGSSPHAVVIEGDDVTPARTVVLNKPEADPLTGVPYLSNDLQRTMLQVGLEDVPSSPTYRGQQLNALSEAIKSLPAQYQAAAMPFLASLMDVPFKRALVEALRAASAQETPEQVEKRIQEAVQDALAKAGNDLKARELDMKERLTEAQIKQIMAQAVQTGVQAAFAAMQGGAQVAQMPMIAPIADAIMQGAGYKRPMPGGDDPNFPTPAQTAAMNIKDPYVQGQGPALVATEAQEEAAAAPPVRENTSPTFPPRPADGASGMDGIETARTTDNVPA